MASAKSKSKQEEALALLNDLDKLNTQSSSAGTVQSSSPNTAAPAGSAPTGASSQGEDVLAFLDEITQKSSEPTRSSTPRSATPTLRKSTERVRVGISAGPMRSSLSSDGTGSLTAPMMRSSLSTASSTTAGDVTAESPSAAAPAPAAAPAQSGGWGWGNVWSSASAALQQARTVVDEQVKQARTVVDERVSQNEQAKRVLEYAQARGGTVLEYAKSAQLDKLGQDFKRMGLSTLTDILNVVAPPISEHEVIQIWLSYDMRGYEGVEDLTYRSLSRLMEQVEGGDLVLNRGGPESRPKDDKSGTRELNAVEGYDAALKLSQANLQDLIKHVTSTSATPPNTSSIKNPTTYSDVYLRIQPYTSSLTLPAPPSLPTTSSPPEKASLPPPQQQEQQQLTLHFLLDLSDPGHALQFTTTTQPVPAAWLEVWDDAGNEWVEDLVAEALRVGVEVVGQQYLAARMGWGQKKKQAPMKEEEGVGAAGKVKGKEVKSAEEDEEDEDEDDEDDEEEEEEEEESVDEDGVVVEKE